MSHQITHAHRAPFLKRFWKPAAVTGASGTALALWLDEIVAFSQEILALLLLPIMAGLIYLLDIFMFKDHLPKREDITKPTDEGAKK